MRFRFLGLNEIEDKGLNLDENQLVQEGVDSESCKGKAKIDRDQEIERWRFTNELMKDTYGVVKEKLRAYRLHEHLNRTQRR